MEHALGSTVLANPAEPLSLRVCGGPRDGQLIRLAGPKCTIGSDSHCTLRLRGPGIRPVHCLILRGQAPPVVRRWSPDTLVNGQSFEEAVLSPGDRLQCGPAVFQVAAADEGSLPIDSVRCPTVVLDPTAAGGSSSDADCQALREQLRAEREVWESERESWEAERKAWESQRREWETQRRTADEALDQQRELVEKLLAKAHSQLSTINRDMDAWRHRAPDEEEKLRAEAVRLAEERTALEAMRRDLEAREAEVRRLMQQAPAARSDYAGSHSHLEAVEADLPFEQAAETPSVPSTHAWDRSVLESGGDSDLEPSVEQYMADLLRRVGGRPASASSATSVASDAAALSVAGDGMRKTAPPTANQAPSPNAELRKSSVPGAPPRRPPETTSDLATLREVANLHTQAALLTHGKRRAMYAAWGKFAVSLTGLSTGAAMLWGGHETPEVTYPAWAAIIIGLAWCVQLSFAIRKLRRTPPQLSATPSASAVGPSPQAATPSVAP